MFIAIGKVGAVFGSFLFSYIGRNVSYGAVMGISCVFALIGVALTVFLVDSKTVYASTGLGSIPQGFLVLPARGSDNNSKTSIEIANADKNLDSKIEATKNPMSP